MLKRFKQILNHVYEKCATDVLTAGSSLACVILVTFGVVETKSRTERKNSGMY